jgi:demethylmenaquinone methyltransferase/2-methoxy-6-polyprenyl-1,4-benzoquinol methylase
MTDVPVGVRAARTIAAEAGFDYSSDDKVGRLLSVLAAATPTQGRVLQLGTGTGVGLAWIVHGLGDRHDVQVVTVEADADVSALAKRQAWPLHVEFIVDDAVGVLPSLGQFDLLFADAQGGKWDRLDLTIQALRPGGVLVVDDMTAQDWWSADQAANQEQVRKALLGYRSLVTVELDWVTGVILCTRPG